MFSEEELRKKGLGELFRLREEVLNKTDEAVLLAALAMSKTKKESDKKAIEEEVEKAAEKVAETIKMIEGEIKRKRQEYKEELEKSTKGSFKKLMNEVEKLEMEKDPVEKQAKYFIVDEVLNDIIRRDREKNIREEEAREFKNAKELERRIRHLKRVIEVYKKKAEREEEKMISKQERRRTRGEKFVMIDSPYGFHEKNLLSFIKKAADAKNKLRVHKKRRR